MNPFVYRSVIVTNCYKRVYHTRNCFGYWRKTTEDKKGLKQFSNSMTDIDLHKGGEYYVQDQIIMYYNIIIVPAELLSARSNEANLWRLISGYHEYGHRAAKTDPLKTPQDM